MTEPRRLSSVSPSPLTRALLDAGRNEAPSHESRQGAAMAIGLAGTLVTTATASAGAAGTGTATVAASKWLGAIGALKLAGTTLITGAIVVGVMHEQHQLALPTVPARGNTVAMTAPVAVTPARRAKTPEIQVFSPPPPSPQSAADDIVVAPAPPALAATPRGASAIAVATASPPARVTEPAPSPPLSAPDDASLRDEVERLDRARVSLAAGRTASTLAQVDAYALAFPQGALRDEAELLRIEAMAQTGRADDSLAARSRAERLLAGDEHGPHARRLRAIIASLRSASGGR
jgi:hypothetical protein